MYVDGEMLDNDFPFGYPHWSENAQWKLDPELVKRAALYLPGIKPTKRLTQPADTMSGIQYWTPRGHNNWVGDVETIYYQGRYHVFYLYDRRHHQSKFGCGAHYFEHLSTTDFKTWTEHEAATPLEQQWECIGTGVPFVYSNQLCLSYGLHTTRVYPEAKTTLPRQWEYLKRNGHTGTFKEDTTPGVPAGATYALSTDGISNFSKSHVMFHPCQNPSVFTAPGGKLLMIANYGSKGLWESESLDGGWRCMDPDFPPGGDCTIFFRWGRFDYIIGGLTGLWSKPADAPDTAYEDLARRGLDFYDGSNVPALTEIPGGRVLMAAWIPIRGWGGTLLIRELTQLPDGRIGSKWMKGIMPETAKPSELASRVADAANFPTRAQSFLLTFNVRPRDSKNGRFRVCFQPESPEQQGCEFQIDLGKQRAQFASGVPDQFATPQKSLREGGAPHQVGNYSIEHLLGVEKPFSMRVLVKRDEKIGGTIIDAEIAGQRTIITYRPDLSVDKLMFATGGLELHDLRLSQLLPDQPRP